MSKAIKLLISGFEASGKSTMSSKISDALIINFDGKTYNMPNTVSTDFKEYSGIANLAEFINEKIRVYKEKLGVLPKFIILDTITALYAQIVSFNSKKYKGFEVFKANEADTLLLNDYLENILIANGISVIVVAHAKFEETKNCYVIPAQGQFKDRGSWQSYVNDSIFLDKTANKRNVYLKSLKFPARSTIYDLENTQEEVFVPASEYDINEHIEKLLNATENNNITKI